MNTQIFDEILGQNKLQEFASANGGNSSKTVMLLRSQGLSDDRIKDLLKHKFSFSDQEAAELLDDNSKQESKLTEMKEPFNKAIPKHEHSNMIGEIETIVKRAIRNPANKNLVDDIAYIGQLQSVKGLTPTQSKVLGMLYDELTGDCDPDTLQWITNKWV